MNDKEAWETWEIVPTSFVALAENLKRIEAFAIDITSLFGAYKTIQLVHIHIGFWKSKESYAVNILKGLIFTVGIYVCINKFQHQCITGIAL